MCVCVCMYIYIYIYIYMMCISGCESGSTILSCMALQSLCQSSTRARCARVHMAGPCMCIYTCMAKQSTGTHVYMRVCVCSSLNRQDGHVCVSVDMHVCMYVRMYLTNPPEERQQRCMYVYVYTWVCIHTGRRKTACAHWAQTAPRRRGQIVKGPRHHQPESNRSRDRSRQIPANAVCMMLCGCLCASTHVCMYVCMYGCSRNRPRQIPADAVCIMLCVCVCVCVCVCASMYVCTNVCSGDILRRVFTKPLCYEFSSIYVYVFLYVDK
jgi:hypothetical protein